jgi:hypothetical protein
MNHFTEDDFDPLALPETPPPLAPVIPIAECGQGAPPAADVLALQETPLAVTIKGTEPVLKPVPTPRPPRPKSARQPSKATPVLPAEPAPPPADAPLPPEPPEHEPPPVAALRHESRASEKEAALKVEPHDLAAEVALLGCCLIDADHPASTITKARAAGVNAGSFYDPRNAKLWTAIARLQEASPPVTDWLLLEELTKRGELDAVGGQGHVVELTTAVSTTAYASRFIAEVVESAQRRQLIRAARELAERAADIGTPVAEVASDFRARFDRVGEASPGLGQSTTAAALCSHPPAVPPEIIFGLLYRGGHMMLSGPSKAHKTFTFLDAGIAVATGTKWLGAFGTTRSPVLYLNFELAEHSFQRRLTAICGARGLQPPGDFHSLNLRGRTTTLATLAADLPREIRRTGAGLVFIDPWYKIAAQSGAEENSNDGQARVLAEAERIVTGNGAALVVGHHFAKGNAGAKSSIDRAAGAGSMGRWGDVIATLTDHEEEDAMVLEFSLRDFAPVAPLVLRWDYPVWKLDHSLDPSRLKKTSGRKDEHPPGELLKVLRDGMTNTEWRGACGWSESTFRTKRGALLAQGKIRAISGSWYVCPQESQESQQ